MSSKSIATVREIANELSIRTSLALTESVDASGNATLQIGSGAAGAAGGFLRVVSSPQTSPGKNSIKQTQPVYAPLKIQLALEANFAGTTDNVADVQGWENLLPILGVALSRGMLVEVWQSANGTAPSATTFDTSTNLKASFHSHAVFGAVASS